MIAGTLVTAIRLAAFRTVGPINVDVTTAKRISATTQLNFRIHDDAPQQLEAAAFQKQIHTRTTNNGTTPDAPSN
jgi:hypothetical protein